VTRSAPLHLLILEDRPDDAELMVAELRADGFDVSYERVDNEAGFREGLAKAPDVVLSDYSLPTFDALSALEIAQDEPRFSGPVIIVTGDVSDEKTVACIRAGAADYIFKDRPGRLGQAVAACLTSQALDERGREAESRRRSSEERFKAVVESIDDTVFTLDREHRYTGIYGRWLEREGMVAENFIGRTAIEVFGADATPYTAAIDRALADEPQDFDSTLGSGAAKRYFEIALSPLHDDAMEVVGVVGITRETTDRQRGREQLDDARKETIRRLLVACELRDDDTGTHAARVGRSAAMLAGKLNFDPEYCEMLELAAAMHDVGKIGIPDSILLKPGRLTDSERETMEHHTQIGHKLLAGSNVELLELAAELAVAHHEWFDGSGYPYGLREHAIPLSGRITAIADVFDALTTARVYRPAFSPRAATEIMRAESGSHFDPALLALFLDSNNSGARRGAQSTRARNKRIASGPVGAGEWLHAVGST
jgi:PAS domain S-box-containing protein